VTFPTEARELIVEGRARVPILDHEIGATFGGGFQRFGFSIAGPAMAGTLPLPDLPSVNYRFLRYGLDARLAVRSFAVEVAAGFRQVFALGGIEDDVWFPHARANGVDFAMALAQTLPLGLGRHAIDLRVGVDFRRYFFDMRSRPGDGFVAGGALDRHLGFSLGVGYRF
jgi:hypothetical protein